MATCYTVGIVGWVTMLLLVMGGAEPVHAENFTACASKRTECAQITNDLKEVATSGGDILAVCPSAIQNLTQCVEAAKTVCQQEHQDTLQVLLNKTNGSLCTPNGRCQVELGRCNSPLENLLQANDSTPPAYRLINSCGLMRGVWDCLQKLDVYCKELVAVKVYTSQITRMFSVCKNITNGWSCMEAPFCFTALSSEGSKSCKIIADLIDCLREKSQSSNCSLDQSPVTFATIREEIPIMCAVQSQRCPASQRCFNQPALSHDPTSRDTPTVTISSQTVTVNFTSPAFYCRLLVLAAECYMEKKHGCGYNSDDMKKVEATYKRLKKRCPADTSNASRWTVLYGVMAVLLPLWASVWSLL